MKPLHILLLIVAGIIVVVAANSLFTVKETEQAMVLQLGKVKELIAEPGLKVKSPFVQQVLFFDKRIMETDSAAEEIQTKDKKRLVVDSFTRWRIVDAKKFYQAVRTEERARSRLNIIINSNLRRMLAQYELLQIVSGERAQVMNQILEASREEADPLGIEVVDVRIKRTDLPEANSRAIYNRMQAERQKEAKEIRATGAEEAQKIRADADKQRTIILAEAKRDAQKMRGEGEAEAIRLTANAFSKDTEFYRLTRSLEAYQSSLKGEDSLLVLDPDMEFLEYLQQPRP